MWLIVIGVWFLLPIVSWIFFDLLIFRLRAFAPTEWTKEGCPMGMFHIPEGSRWFAGSMAKSRLMKYLIFMTPDWARRDQQSLLFLRLYQLFNAVWLVAGVTGLVVALVRS